MRDIQYHFNAVALDIIKRVERSSAKDACRVLNLPLNTIRQRASVVHWRQAKDRGPNPCLRGIMRKDIAGSDSMTSNDQMNFLDLAAEAENYLIFTEVDAASKVLESRWFGGGLHSHMHDIRMFLLIFPFFLFVPLLHNSRSYGTKSTVY
jgi:hypothetical protein